MIIVGTVTVDGQDAGTLTLDDARGLQRHDFAPTEARVVRLEIRAVYPGSRWEDTALSEVRFLVE